ncbi:Pao retrotransposon peptidase, partial [Ostertagia ostertagi]
MDKNILTLEAIPFLTPPDEEMAVIASLNHRLPRDEEGPIMPAPLHIRSDGFGAPLLIKQKQLMRTIFQQTAEWTTKIDPGLIQEWLTITKDIDKFHIRVSRQLIRPRPPPHQNNLWVFADASNQAMAVCAYMVDTEVTEFSSLISGKTMLAPKKRQLSIPRLELLAILLALRLAESISTTLYIVVSDIFIVSDSRIALSWIRTSRKLPLFIMNQRDRIRTIINRLTARGHGIHLLHIPGARNLADAGTRGATAAQLACVDWVTLC